MASTGAAAEGGAARREEMEGEKEKGGPAETGKGAVKK